MVRVKILHQDELMSQNEDFFLGILDLIRAVEPEAPALSLPRFVHKLNSPERANLQVSSAGTSLQALAALLAQHLSIPDEAEALLARAQIELALERIHTHGGLFGWDQTNCLIVQNQEQTVAYRFALDLIKLS